MVSHVSLAAAFAFGIALLAADPATAACNAEPGPCVLEGGSYHIDLPPGETGTAARPEADGTARPRQTRPAVLFVHGHGSSGQGTMTNRGMVAALLARGYAVIAPDGMPLTGRDGRSWSFRPGQSGARDDIAFLQAVRDDAARRFGLDPARMLLGGFSVGGSMVSYLACADPGAFAAYAPVSGGFWRPHPETCAGPVQLLHTHGWTDTTVPLEGRILRIGGSETTPVVIAQGDIFRTMEIWRATNHCDQYRADAFEVTGAFWRRSWQRCTPGSALELALFPGAHMIPEGWADLALDWFEALPPS